MAEAGDTTTVIGADTFIKGELTFEQTARINGKFEGQINGKGELQVQNNALCKANVTANSVFIDGTVEGNLHAKDTVKLNAKGVVRGDVVASKMTMAEGASFYGQVAVGPDASAKAGVAREAAAATQPQGQKPQPQGQPQAAKK